LYEGSISHDRVTRFLCRSYLDSKDLWLASKPLIRSCGRKRKEGGFAVLIVDDSMLEKAHTDGNAVVCVHFDHSQGRYVKGPGFLSLPYQADGPSVPVAAQPTRKNRT